MTQYHMDRAEQAVNKTILLLVAAQFTLVAGIVVSVVLASSSWEDEE